MPCCKGKLMTRTWYFLWLIAIILGNSEIMALVLHPNQKSLKRSAYSIRSKKQRWQVSLSALENKPKIAKSESTVRVRTAAAAAAAGSAAFVVCYAKRSSLLTLYQGYEAAALKTPILTKACTSGVAYLLGDSLAQLLSKRENFDFGRVARSTIAGFFSHGPQLHFWCMFLDKFVGFRKRTYLSLPFKILLDQTFFALYLNGAYCAIIETLKGSTRRSIWRRVRTAALPSLFSSWKFWPFVHLITYSIVPFHLRVLWVDVVEVVWVAILANCAAAAAEQDITSAETSVLGEDIRNDALSFKENPSTLVETVPVA